MSDSPALYSSVDALIGGNPLPRFGKGGMLAVRSALPEQYAMGTFELFQDKAGDFRFRLKAANGEIILASEGYGTKADAEEGIEVAQKLAPEAMNYERKRTDAGHSFTLQAYNGEVVGTSEVYTSTTARDKGIEAVKKHAPGAEVIIV